MKKFFAIMLVALMVMLVFEPVSALHLWSSNQNTYYQRSQHTYSWTEPEPSGKYWTRFAPAIYILYKDKDLAMKEEEWSFFDTFKEPYTVNEDDYVLTLCADLVYDFWPVKEYNVVNINDSKVIKDEIKSQLAGIVKNSYPFISQETMVQNLVKEGVLVETQDAEGKTIYTAKANVEALEEGEHVQFSIHRDELLSAIQHAIFHYTDPGVVNDIYYTTVGTLSTNFPVIDRQANYSVTEDYEEVANNIEAVYDYLITLEDEDSTSIIKSATAQERADGSLYFTIAPTKDVKEPKNLSVEFILNDDVVSTVALSKLYANKDGSYSFNVPDVKTVEGLKIRLTGKTLINGEVNVYEAMDGREDSQTLIGVTSIEKDVDTVENDVVLSGVKAPSCDLDNNGQCLVVPNTIDNANVYMICALLSLMTLGIAYIVRKRIA